MDRIKVVTPPTQLIKNLLAKLDNAPTTDAILAIKEQFTNILINYALTKIDEATVCTAIAKCYTKLGHYTTARQYYIQALNRHPNNEETSYQMASLTLHYTGEFAVALIHAKSAVHQHYSVRNLTMLAECFLCNGENTLSQSIYAELHSKEILPINQYKNFILTMLYEDDLDYARHIITQKITQLTADPQGLNSMDITTLSSILNFVSSADNFIKTVKSEYFLPYIEQLTYKKEDYTQALSNFLRQRAIRYYNENNSTYIDEDKPIQNPFLYGAELMLYMNRLKVDGTPNGLSAVTESLFYYDGDINKTGKYVLRSSNYYGAETGEVYSIIDVVYPTL